MHTFFTKNNFRVNIHIKPQVRTFKIISDNSILVVLPLLLITLQTQKIFARQPYFPLRHPVSYAQEYLGEIRGHVTGDLIRVTSVAVELMQNEKIIDETMTDEEGNFSFPYLNPGHYDIKGSKTGYRTSITYSVPVWQNEITTHNFYLPKFNNKNMNRYPVVERYQEMRH